MSRDPSTTAVVSVPFSGTRFLRHTLSIPKSVHTYMDPTRILEYIQGVDLFVIPLRDPRTNWVSWARRWPEKGKTWDKRIAEFERAWLGMAWFLEGVLNSDNATVLVYPLDQMTNVGSRLADDASKHNLEYKPDVPKIGNEDHGSNTYEYDVSHIYKYDFVRRYYHE